MINQINTPSPSLQPLRKNNTNFIKNNNHLNSSDTVVFKGNNSSRSNERNMDFSIGDLLKKLLIKDDNIIDLFNSPPRSDREILNSINQKSLCANTNIRFKFVQSNYPALLLRGPAFDIKTKVLDLDMKKTKHDPLPIPMSIKEYEKNTDLHVQSSKNKTNVKNEETYNMKAFYTDLKNIAQGRKIFEYDLRGPSSSRLYQGKLKKLDKNLIKNLEYKDFDWNTNNDDNKEDLMQEVKQVLKDSNNMVYVHCNQGNDRTGAFLDLLKS